MELIELVLKHLVINHFLHCNYSKLKIVGKAYSYPYVFSILLALKNIFQASPKMQKFAKES